MTKLADFEGLGHTADVQFESSKVERLGNLLQLDGEVRIHSRPATCCWRRACMTIGQDFAGMDSLSVLVATTSR